MYYGQTSYDCRVEWGPRGAREAAERGDITVIVDVLSFSSTVVTALSCGADIFPFPPSSCGEDREYAQKLGAELMVGRAEGSRTGRPSLSPVTFGPLHAGKKYVLCSLNGAVCTWTASKVPSLLVGCLLNASRVAAAAEAIRAQTGAAITVIPCGERWSDALEGEDGLRPALEDYLGAGAVLAGLRGTQSPEAEVCAGAFRQARHDLPRLLRECGSGRELGERGFADDVAHSCRLDALPVVPVLREGRFVAFE
ncbi:2-phosphosulfolactate phosphatase [Paenibacillus hamazuiensis]|uniref:2-phosphosulfolactate phosphatase n=1 Tax=Paenibacillus hamazuiensis TaxID=2936508 RepID=UPI00201022B5|nr:2-phosphosulfolactate phosphatase [Paenibacillus hamazuiensis]